MILITGGSSGIGEALVLALAGEGEPCFFTYRTGKSRAQELQAQTNGLARALYLDLADPQGPAAVMSAIEAAGSSVTRLVNNAGIHASGLLAMTSDSSLAETIEVNLMGTFRMMKCAVPHLLRNKGGSIVNVVSLAAIHPLPGQGAYAATKSALLTMTRSMAREMGRKRIRVNAIAPGYLSTGMTRDLNVDHVDRMRRSECLPDGVSMDCVVAAIRFLLSSHASSVTGQCLVVDAGASV